MYVLILGGSILSIQNYANYIFFLQNWGQISVPLKCGSHSTNDFGVGLIQYAPHDSSRPTPDE